jgi:hypothetical protein
MLGEEVLLRTAASEPSLLRLLAGYIRLLEDLPLAGPSAAVGL